MHRKRRTIGRLTGLGFLVTLLAGCSLGTTSTPASAAAAATPTATVPPTATVAPTATPFFVNGIAYQRVTDSMFGFSIALPADMQLNLQEPAPQNNGDHVIWMSADANAQTAMEVDFGGGVANFQPNQCPGAISGPLISVVTVGQGIKAYQDNGLTIGHTSTGGAAIPSISVSFVSKGIVVGISLKPYSQGRTGDELMAQYGPIWQEMLMSFKPGAFVNPTPPCGS